MMRRITLVLNLSKERIITRIDGDICIDETPGSYAVDGLTLKVLALGTRARELSEGFDRRLNLAVVDAFDKGTVLVPRTVAADCLRGIVRRSFSMRGSQGIFRPHFDVIVCDISPECSEDDLDLIRRTLCKEGARKVTFTSVSEEELRVTEDGRYDLGGTEIKAPRHLRPLWVVLGTLLAPWILYLPLALKYGAWEIHIQAWLFIEICVVAALTRRRRRAVSSRLRRARITLPEMRSQRWVAWMAVICMMLATAAVAIFFGRSRELSLVYRAMLFSVPLAILWYQTRATRRMKDDCYFLDRRALFEAERQRNEIHNQ